MSDFIIKQAHNLSSATVPLLLANYLVISQGGKLNKVSLATFIEEISKGINFDSIIDKPVIPEAAADLSYDNAISGLISTDVKSAIDELGSIVNNINDSLSSTFTDFEAKIYNANEVVKETKWGTASKLVSLQALEDDLFGYAVDISENNICIVGAPTTSQTDAGAAYVYKKENNTWVEKQQLIGADTVDNNWFGNSVAISDDGTKIVVGARYESTNGAGAGAIYVLSTADGGETWIQDQKITPSAPSPGDDFGYEIAISGDSNIIAVGAVGDEDAGINAGTVWLFKWNGVSYGEIQKITGSTIDDSDLYGSSISITETGDRIAIGAPGASTNAGKVFIFQSADLNTWAEEAELTCSDTAEDFMFGSSVDITRDGLTLMCGAKGAKINGDTVGKVYEFSYDTEGLSWSEQSIIIPSDFATRYSANTNGVNGAFGCYISVSENAKTIIVGDTVQGPDGGDNTGAAYIFEKENGIWAEEAIIKDVPNVSNSNMGKAAKVSLDGTTFIIGHPGDILSDVSTGSITIANKNIRHEEIFDHNDIVTRLDSAEINIDDITISYVTHITTDQNEGIAAEVNTYYFVDTTASTANITITMPVEVNVGDIVKITDLKYNFEENGTKNIVTDTILFEGVSQEIEIDVRGVTAEFLYTGEDYGWKAILSD